MPNAIQTFLSSRPARTTTAHLPIITGPHQASHIWFQKEGRYDYLYEEHYISTHPKAQGGKAGSQSGPGLHLHLKQDEYFKVVEGKLGVSIDGKDHYLTPESPEAIVPAGSVHRFWPEEGGGQTGNLIIKVRVDKYPGGFDERFMRNMLSYIADCEKANTSPSLFQIILFGYAHDICLAFPLPRAILQPLHWFLGYVVASRLLGYQESYPEYYATATATIPPSPPIQDKKDL